MTCKMFIYNNNNKMDDVINFIPEHAFADIIYRQEVYKIKTKYALDMVQNTITITQQVDNAKYIYRFYGVGLC